MASIWQSSEIWFLVGSLLLLLVGAFVLFINQIDRSTPMPQATLMPTTMVETTWTPTSAFDELTQLPIIWRKPLEYEDPPPIPPPEQALQLIEVERPTCYGLANATYSCVGRLWNHGDTSLGDTSFDFAFYDTLETEITRASTTIEQRLILPDDFAPYRTVLPRDFAVLEAQSEHTTVEVTHNATLISTSNARNLRVLQADGQLNDNGLYQLSVTVENDTGYPVESVRIITTLSSIEWGIVGYQVNEVGENMQNGAQYAVDVAIIPYALSDDISHTVHAEALIPQD
ncbi:MAG: hypothetical protein AAFV93_18210 [Chloroflexota bacterium]